MNETAMIAPVRKSIRVKAGLSHMSKEIIPELFVPRR
jgi:hypothetical protein